MNREADQVRALATDGTRKAVRAVVEPFGRLLHALDHFSGEGKFVEEVVEHVRNRR
jgi:P2-related tail formation protein